MKENDRAVLAVENDLLKKKLSRQEELLKSTQELSDRRGAELCLYKNVCESIEDELQEMSHIDDLETLMQKVESLRDQMTAYFEKLPNIDGK